MHIRRFPTELFFKNSTLREACLCSRRTGKLPLITVQLGQCGNQLGCSFFQTLAAELGNGDYHASGLEEWFRISESGTGRQRYVSRSVLVDMEPKVVSSVIQTVSQSRSWWSYPQDRQLCMSSGAGNNWAHGFHGYGPKVHDAALELVRREAEACDVLGGFLLMQSMAGGTGAGLGTYVAAALRDEYPSSHAINCCVWPYETGEVIVQAYNTLFTLSHLTDVSDGIILMENESLHRTAHRLYAVPRPSFQDMNVVAARALGSLLLPSHHRAAGSSLPQSGTGDSPGTMGADRRLRRQISSPGVITAGGGGGDSEGMMAEQLSGMHVTPKGDTGTSAARSPATPAVPGRPVRVLSELVGHCSPHPGYRLMSLRTVPQVPAQSVDFTTFTWPAITKRMRQMMITGSSMDEGMDWGVGISTPGVANSMPSPGSVTPPPATVTSTLSTPRSGGSTGVGGGTQSSRHKPATAAAGGGGKAVNKSISSWIMLRGQGAGDVDISGLFNDAGLYVPWSMDPLAVSWHPARYARCAMTATQLAADQACIGPCMRMQERAYSMWASRAYVHQYEKYGLTGHDFENCFAHVEDVMERYATM